MKLEKKRTKGFTIIEVLVVVLIVSVIAAISVPTYLRAVEKTKASQAVTTLTSIAKAQMAYNVKHGRYSERVLPLPLELTDAQGNNVVNSEFSDSSFAYTVYGQDLKKAVAVRDTNEYTLYVDYVTGKIYCQAQNNSVCRRLGFDVENLSEEENGGWAACTDGDVEFLGFSMSNLESIGAYCSKNNDNALSATKICGNNLAEGFPPLCIIVLSGGNIVDQTSVLCFTSEEDVQQCQTEYMTFGNWDEEIAPNTVATRSCDLFDEETVTCLQYSTYWITYWDGNDSDEGNDNYWTCSAYYDGPDVISESGDECLKYYTYRTPEIFCAGETNGVGTHWHGRYVDVPPRYCLQYPSFELCPSNEQRNACA